MFDLLRRRETNAKGKTQPIPKTKPITKSKSKSRSRITKAARPKKVPAALGSAASAQDEVPSVPSPAPPYEPSFGQQPFFPQGGYPVGYGGMGMGYGGMGMGYGGMGMGYGGMGMGYGGMGMGYGGMGLGQRPIGFDSTGLGFNYTGYDPMGYNQAGLMGYGIPSLVGGYSGMGYGQMGYDPLSMSQSSLMAYGGMPMMMAPQTFMTTPAVYTQQEAPSTTVHDVDSVPKVVSKDQAPKEGAPKDAPNADEAKAEVLMRAIPNETKAVDEQPAQVALMAVAPEIGTTAVAAAAAAAAAAAVTGPLTEEVKGESKEDTTQQQRLGMSPSASFNSFDESADIKPGMGTSFNSNRPGGLVRQSSSFDLRPGGLVRQSSSFNVPMVLPMGLVHQPSSFMMNSFPQTGPPQQEEEPPQPEKEPSPKEEAPAPIPWYEVPEDFTLPDDTPAGLEKLAAVNGLMVHQQVEGVVASDTGGGFEGRNKYRISNRYGVQMYQAVEDTNFFWRCCFGALRPAHIRVFDSDGTEVISMQRRVRYCPCAWLPCCYENVDVFHGARHRVKPIGRVTQPFCGGCCRPKLTIHDENYEEELWVKGACCFGDLYGSEFHVLGNDRSKIGKVKKMGKKAFREFGVEKLTDADSFLLTFPHDLKVETKATTLMTLFLLDFMFFESGSSNTNTNKMCSCHLCTMFFCGCPISFSCNGCGGRPNLNKNKKSPSASEEKETVKEEENKEGEATEKGGEEAPVPEKINR